MTDSLMEVIQDAFHKILNALTPDHAGDSYSIIKILTNMLYIIYMDENTGARINDAERHIIYDEAYKNANRLYENVVYDEFRHFSPSDGSDEA